MRDSLQKKDFETLCRIRLVGSDVSKFDCNKCKWAKEILKAKKEGQEIEPQIIQQAIQHKRFVTDIYCGDDCDKPKELPQDTWIDLKDGINYPLRKNPYPILKDKFLSDYFIICTLASGGLFPVVGGVYDQPSEFIELYEIYIQWKEVASQIKTAKLLGANNQ